MKAINCDISEMCFLYICAMVSDYCPCMLQKHRKYTEKQDRMQCLLDPHYPSCIIAIALTCRTVHMLGTGIDQIVQLLTRRLNAQTFVLLLFTQVQGSIAE